MAGQVPTIKILGIFDFTAIPSLNKMLVLELALCELILRRDNVIALGNSGTGKGHVALALGLAIAFTTAGSLAHKSPRRETALLVRRSCFSKQGPSAHGELDGLGAPVA